MKIKLIMTLAMNLLKMLPIEHWIALAIDYLNYKARKSSNKLDDKIMKEVTDFFNYIRNKYSKDIYKK